MRPNAKLSRAGSDDDAISRLIKEAIDLVSRARALWDRVPELHIGSPTSINLGSFGLESVAVKQDIGNELALLATSLDRLQLRARLPLVIGVIGKYNTGKSSLLNRFFREICDGTLPPGLERRTENTATDTVLTYITHPDFAFQFGDIPEITTVPVNKEMFRTINFIDTPGTGWKSLERKEVVDLLSSADILLFVSKPLELLDSVSVGVLDQKFSSFNETPMWYVITFASMYTKPDSSSTAPDESQFHKLLTEAKAKLQVRPYSSADELRARDLVSARVSFDLNVNTFLVDSMTGFGTHELLEKILLTFNNSEARIARRKGLRTEVKAAYGSLWQILNRAVSHVSAIGTTVNQAYRRSIHPEIEKFVANGLAAECSQVIQILHAHLGEARWSIDQHVNVERPVPTLTHSTEPAEVTILRSDLESMKDKKQSHTYEYRSENILFDLPLIVNRMESLKLSAVHSISRQLEGLWSDHPNEGLPPLSSSLSQTIHAVIDEGVQGIEKIILQRVESRCNALADFLRVPTLRLRNRYSSAEIGSTIFSRQAGVLREMEHDIPLNCKQLRSKLKSTYETAQAVRGNLAAKFKSVVESRVAAFADSAAVLLHDSVYVPTQESLFFILGDPEPADSRLPNRDETRQELGSIALTLTDSVRRGDTELSSSLKQINDNVQSALLEAKNHWDREWNELNRQFGVLADSAKDVAATLDQHMLKLRNALDSAKSDGVHTIKIQIRETATQMSNGVRTKADKITASIKESGAKVALKYWLELGGLLLTLAGSSIGLWRSWPVGKTPLTPFFIILVMGSAITVWITKQLRTLRDEQLKMLHLKFKVDVEDLQRTVIDIADRQISKMCDNAERHNRDLADALNSLYEAVIDACGIANEKIIPNLMSLIETGARVALSTQERIATTAATGIARLAQSVTTGMEKTASETVDQMRNELAIAIRSSGERCGNAVKKHIGTYRNLSEDFQQLISSVKKMNAEATLSAAGN